MRLSFHVVAVLVGAAVSLATVAVHRSELFGIPLGLTLGLLASFATAWAMRETQPRLAASYAVGWLVAFGTAVLGKPEGDFVVATDLSGYALMAAALVMIVIGVSALAARDAGSRPRPHKISPRE